MKSIKKKISTILKSAYLSRLSLDYYIFLLAIISVAIISTFLSVKGIESEKKQSVIQQSEGNAFSINSEINSYFNNIERIAEYMGRKIAEKGAEDKENIHYLFKRRFSAISIESFNEDIVETFQWPAFDWVTPDGNVKVSSLFGIINEPYSAIGKTSLYSASIEPWKLHISKMVYSKDVMDNILPVAFGVYDSENKHIGTIVSYVETQKILKAIKETANIDDSYFIITDIDSNIIINSFNKNSADISNNIKTQDLESNKGKLQKPFSIGSAEFVTYLKSQPYPYIVYTGYDTFKYSEAYSNLVENIIYNNIKVALIVLAVLFIFYFVTIRPVRVLSNKGNLILKGASKTDIGRLPRGSSVDTYNLSKILVLFQRTLKSRNILLEQEKNSKQLLQDAIEKEHLTNAELLEQAKEVEQAKKDLQLQINRAISAKRSREGYLASLKRDSRQQIGEIVERASLLIQDKTMASRSMDINDEINYLMEIINISEQILTNTIDKVICSYVNIAEIIEKCVVRQLDEEVYADFKISYKVQEDITGIYTDDRKLEQILTGLIYRSIEDYPRSYINIEASSFVEKDAKFLKVTVSDDGNGLSEEDWKKRIASYDNNKSVARGTNGTDLEYGAILKLVELLKGKLEYNNNLLKSTHICITIPYLTEADFYKDNSSNISDNLSDSGNITDISKYLNKTKEPV